MGCPKIRVNKKYTNEKGTFIIMSHAPDRTEVLNYGAKRTYLVYKLDGAVSAFLGRYFKLKEARQRVYDYDASQEWLKINGWA